MLLVIQPSFLGLGFKNFSLGFLVLDFCLLILDNGLLVGLFILHLLTACIGLHHILD